MAKHVESPADVQIAALQKEERRFGNLLASGSGTPWEDRGSIGFIPAFFKTAIKSMTSPNQLLYSIRRPETASDARIFAILCGVCWGLSWVIQDYLDFLWHIPKIEWDYVDQGYVWAIHFALGLAGCWLLLSLVVRVFYKLISAGDMRSKYPTVLQFNVYAYCLGPSLIALIPFKFGGLFIGWTIALIWIYFLFVYAAINRLAIKPLGSIICNAITVWGFFGLAVAAWYIACKVFGWLY